MKTKELKAPNEIGLLWPKIEGCIHSLAEWLKWNELWMSDKWEMRGKIVAWQN